MQNQLFALLTRLSPKSDRRRRRSAVRGRAKLSLESLEARKLLAAVIWTGDDITSDSNVSTNGTLVFALNGTSGTAPTTTVNGVSFVPATLLSAETQSQAQSPGNESLTTTIGNDNANAFETGGLDAIGQIIQSGWWGADSGNTAIVTLDGLTVGDDYEVQIFANDARGNRHDGYVTRLGNGEGGFGIDLELNNQPVGGGAGARAGDYGIGTFTADATTQVIELAGFLNGNNNGGRLQVNAIQLRKIEPLNLLPGAVPLINEFSASNSNIIDDDNGNSSDWIEIYNAGEDTVDLIGYSLTDDPAEPRKYVFTETTELAGGQYLIVFAGDDDDPTTGSDLYTGFGLSAGGEYLGFFDDGAGDGNLISEFGPGGIDYPAQFTDVSYGLVADDNFDTSSFFSTPTPGSSNVDPVDGVIEQLPTVSVDRGFYDSAFDVDISLQAPGVTVVYTTDGSIPSLTNGARVNAADPNSNVEFSINISETTSLRTAGVKDGFLTRGSTTHTYIFVDDVISSSVLDTSITKPGSNNTYSQAELRAGLLDIPTFSLNFENEITDSFVPEQAASVEWLAPDGSEGFQIDAGISGFGGFFTNFAKKNFRLEFRSQYGASQLEFPLFEGFDNGIAAQDSFDSLDLRSGSHDKVQRGFGLSNRFVDDTLLDAGHAVPHGRFVHIYINGTYWGQYHLRERWDADFLSQYYGGDEDDYEAVNGNINNGSPTPNGWALGEVYDGSGEVWDNITELADQRGDRTPEGPTGGYQELKEVVNLPQYIDYMLIYTAGRSENEYRSGGSTDGSVPYTFTLNDADGWFRGSNGNIANAGPANILGTLVAEGDPEFMTLYADRLQNMFGAGGVLSPERSTERLQERLDEMELSFPLESARWSSVFTDATGSFEARTPQSFENAANSALNNFLPNLGNDMLSDYRSAGLFPSFDAPEFLIDGEFQNGGQIESGDLLTVTATETIYYTTDGTDPRSVGGDINENAIALSASDSSSTVIPENDIWNYLDDGSNQGTLWQDPSFDDSTWASGPAELGYNDDPITEIDFGGVENDKFITTYFRKTFDVTERFDTASLDVFYDDGAVIYLNGQEIGRANMDGDIGDPVSYLETAGPAVPDGVTSNFDISDSLVLGTNTLAIEIHQSAATSSDLSFNAELITSNLLSGPASIPLTETTNVQARALSDDGVWSGIRNATFDVPTTQVFAPQSELKITEIQYNPVESVPDADDGDDFEFIEIYNPNLTEAIALVGAQFIRVDGDGVEITFGPEDVLGPGEYGVIVESLDAFQSRYGTDNDFLLREWDAGGLSNGGELITFIDSDGEDIAEVEYGDSDPWAFAADGNGASLDLIDPVGTPNDLLDKPFSWRASVEIGGTPGAASTAASGILINEILAHTDDPNTDSIELFNPTDSPINIGGWYLSDSGTEPLKFQIPAETVIAAGGYVAFDEDDFNPDLALSPNYQGIRFALSAAEGDEVLLTEVLDGESSLLQDSISFGATFNPVSLGRTPDGTRVVPLANL